MASLPLGDRPSTAIPMAPLAPLATSPPHPRRPTLPERYAPAVGEAALEFVPASYASSTSGRDSPPPRPPSPLLSPAKAVVFLLRPHLLAARLRRQPLVLLVAAAVLASLVLLAAHRGRAGAMAMPSSDSGIPGLPWGSASRGGGGAASSTQDGPAAPDEPCEPLPDSDGAVDACATTRLPHIPPKIWQVYLDFEPRVLADGFIPTWLARAPSHAYVLLDAAGATSVVRRLAHLASGAQPPRVPVYRQEAEAGSDRGGSGSSSSGRSRLEDAPLGFAQDALQRYEAMPRRVLRADFLRYLVLALEGGVYSDFDTALERPLREWVPAGLRAQTRLIVGLEADQTPPVKGTTYPVQFCQWTLASAAGHATMWTMVERILARRPPPGSAAAGAGAGREMADADVLAITGPAAWTEVVYEHLNQVAGDGAGQPRITWHTLTGLKEPRLFGDTLVLPINGFATGVPHSHASRQRTEQTLVQHHFRGDWRNNNG